jgi:hypothetical protein
MNTSLRIVLLSALAFSMGCSQKTEAEKKVETAESQLDTAKKDAKEKQEAGEAAAKKQIEAAQANLAQAKNEAKWAAEDAADYAYDRKADFVAKMKEELEEREEALEALGRTGSEKAREAARPRIEALREKLAQAKERLKEAGDATESTWSDVKASARKSRSELKDAFANTRQWLSDAIEP